MVDTQNPDTAWRNQTLFQQGPRISNRGPTLAFIFPLPKVRRAFRFLKLERPQTSLENESSVGVLFCFICASFLIPVGAGNSLVVCDESGHTKFPFSFVVLSWVSLGELWLICPELSLILS